MKKRVITRFIPAFICFLLLFSGGMTVLAQRYINYQGNSAYYSYEYNCYQELSPAPDGYQASEVFYCSDAGIDMTNSELVDLYFDGERIYLLDAAEGRVIIFNKDFTFESVFSGSDLLAGSFEGTDCDFTGAGGIFVEDDGKILICDTERERVLMIKDRTLVGIIARPDSSALSENVKFDVKKIVKSGDSYYVTAESVISGTMMFDENLNFVRFFGGNTVTVTAEVLLYSIQSAFMSDEQIAASRKFAASKIAGLDVDKNGFLVVASSDQELAAQGTAVRCLNYKGSVIADQFGDLNTVVEDANVFSDIAVDDENFYVLLDTKYQRVFVFSDNSVLVSAFGGAGTQAGLFSRAVAIEAMGNRVLVLDSELNAVTVFDMTDYGKTKRELLKIIDTGRYDEISNLSDELLKRNSNSQYACYAKGFVAQQAGDYKTALAYYEKANEKEAYAQCFKLYRTQYVKTHFIWIALIVIALAAAFIWALIGLSRGLKKKEGAVYAPLECKAGFPLYCLFHPADGFSQIKTRKVLSPVWLAAILVGWVYISVLRFFNVGFVHNMNRAGNFNILIELAKTLGVMAIFVIANWAICTLMEGKGKPFEILYTVSYAMIPYILSLVITFPLTMILTSDEGVILGMIMTIGIIWSGLVAFVGLLTIHEYSVGKAVLSVFLTLVGMAIIVLLIIMFFTLIAQTVSFVQSLIQEYSFRH